MPKQWTPIIGAKTETIEDVLLRLLAVTKASDFRLSPQMLAEIEAISIEGADPEWQIRELKRILDRWAIQH